MILGIILTIWYKKKKCENCNSEIEDDDSVFCKYCGEKIKKE
ncbi:MAG: zinc-ribbon domain-containing protein [Bacteroidales bacterium]|nr:zinc-ribbon domain-containing protein [Bacteroidales bacterium]